MKNFKIYFENFTNAWIFIWQRAHANFHLIYMSSLLFLKFKAIFIITLEYVFILNLGMIT